MERRVRGREGVEGEKGERERRVRGREGVEGEKGE